MRPDTPLEEVAGHLPVQAATVLMDCSSDVQTCVLIQVRNMVVFWETQRYVFDPIAYEGILDASVATLIPLYSELLALRAERAALMSQLVASNQRIMAADQMINAMSETIAEMSGEQP